MRTDPVRVSKPGSLINYGCMVGSVEWWLTAHLVHGPAPFGDLYRDLLSRGFDAKTIYATAKMMGILEGMVDGKKMWRLPPQREARAVHALRAFFRRFMRRRKRNAKGKRPSSHRTERR